MLWDFFSQLYSVGEEYMPTPTPSPEQMPSYRLEDELKDTLLVFIGEAPLGVSSRD